MKERMALFQIDLTWSCWDIMREQTF